MKNMKKVITYAVLTVALLSSCAHKEVKILNTDLQGDLKGSYVILDSVCQASKNDNGKYEIQVNIKRTEESVPYTETSVDTFGSSSEKAQVLGGIGYELYDADDNMSLAVEGRENESNTKQQLNILTLKPGETAPFTIEFDDEVPDGIILTSELDFISTGEVAFNGSIGKYGIKNCTMDFNFKNKKIIGQYQYLSSPAGAYLYLLGNVVTGEYKTGDYSFDILIAEDNGRGELTGKFKGQLKLIRDSKTSPYYYVLLGTFRNFNLRDFRYELKSAPINEIVSEGILKNSYAATMNPAFVDDDFSQFGFRSFKEEAAYDSGISGDISIDDFLREYRRFYKKYARVLKQFKSGDPSAGLEYYELTRQYQVLVKKADEVKGQLSASQARELEKLTQEFVQLMNQ